jgi:tetratricopeptide (TPR) repeat protein
VAINKNKLIASAQRLTQRGQLDRAIREYRTIVENDPDDVRVWMKIGALYVRKGATQHAVATYNRVAAYYQDNGHHQKAAAVYKQIIGLVPGAIDAHLSLADVLARLGQNTEAVNELQIVVGSYEREGRHRDSCELLARIVDLAPDEEANRIRLAEAYARQKDEAGATREFKTVLDQLHGNRRLDDFIQVAERLLYLAPDEIDTVRRLAEVYLQRHQPKRALGRLQVLFQSDPSDTDVLEMLGQAFNDLGYRGKAISVYRELARIQGARGDDSARLNAFRSLLAIDPMDPEALEATGASDPLSMPPTGRRVEVSVTPRAEEPAFEGDHLARFIEDAQLYVKYSLNDYAMARIERALSASPENIDALALKAEVMLAREQLGEAAQLYTQLSELTSGEQAMSFLGKLIELRPDDIDARARLRSISGDMASDRGKVISLSPSPAESVEGFEVELNFDGMDFDDGLQNAAAFGAETAQAESDFDFELDLDALDPLPDDDAFSDLLGGDESPAAEKAADISRRAFGDLSSDDEFGDLLEPDASTSLGANEYDDEFGDLLGGNGFALPTAEAVPDDDAFGDLLAGAPVPDDDAFGDLLAPPPTVRRDASVLLAARPSQTAGDRSFGADGFGEAGFGEDGFGDAGFGEDGFGDDGVGEDDVGADDFGDLLGPPDAPLANGIFSPPPPLADRADDMVAADQPAPADDSFGDLLCDLDYDGLDDDEVNQTAEVMAVSEAEAIDDALAAAVDDEARRQSAMIAAVSDVDFAALPPSNAPPPAGFDLPGSRRSGGLRRSLRPRHSSGAPPAVIDRGAFDVNTSESLEVDLEGFDDVSFEGMFDDAQISPLDDEMFSAFDEQAAQPEEFGSEVVVASLPGVMDSVALSIDLVDDDIVELDDDEFEIEEVSAAPGHMPDSAAPPPPPPPPPAKSTEGLRDRLARLAAPAAKRPAPPPIPGGGLFEMRGAVSDPQASVPPVHVGGGVAGSEFVNISADVEWAELALDLPRLDALLANGDVSGGRALLSELNQEHPGHPALSERLDRILSIESGPGMRQQSGSLPLPLPITGVRSADVSAPPAPALEPSFSGPIAARELGTDDDADTAFGAAFVGGRGLLSSVGVQSTRQGMRSAEPVDQGDDFDFGTIQGSTISELAEDDAMTHFDLGAAFKEMGRYEKSIEQLELARQNSDLYAEATRVLASAHHECGQSEKAVELLREAIGDERVIQAAQLGLRYELAGVFETIGRHADAAVELRLIAQAGSDDFPDVASRLARLSQI